MNTSLFDLSDKFQSRMTQVVYIKVQFCPQVVQTRNQFHMNLYSFLLVSHEREEPFKGLYS